MSVLLFMGVVYYPGGGTRDYQGRFDDQGEALRRVQVLREKDYRLTWNSWWEIVPTDGDGALLVDQAERGGYTDPDEHEDDPLYQAWLDDFEKTYGTRPAK